MPEPPGPRNRGQYLRISASVGRSDAGAAAATAAGGSGVVAGRVVAIAAWRTTSGAPLGAGSSISASASSLSGSSLRDESVNAVAAATRTTANAATDARAMRWVRASVSGGAAAGSGIGGFRRNVAAVRAGHEEHEHAEQQQVAAGVGESPLPKVRLAQREVHRANLFLQRLVARILGQFSLEFEELRRVQRVLDLPPGVVDQQHRADDHREHARHPRRPRRDRVPRLRFPLSAFRFLLHFDQAPAVLAPGGSTRNTVRKRRSWPGWDRNPLAGGGSTSGSASRRRPGRSTPPGPCRPRRACAAGPAAAAYRSSSGRPVLRKASLASVVPSTSPRFSERTRSASATVGSSRDSGTASCLPSIPPPITSTGSSAKSSRQSPPGRRPRLGRLVHGRRVDRPVGTGVLAQPALDALVGRDPGVPLRHLRHEPEDRPVGAKEPAVGPADEDADHQEAAAHDEHVHRAAETEETDERIVPADEKRRAGGRQRHARPKVHVWQKPQRLLQPPRHADRPDGDEFLDRAQRADRRAERAAEEQREQDRQREKRDDHNGNRVRSDRPARASRSGWRRSGRRSPRERSRARRASRSPRPNSPRRDREPSAK